MLTLKLECSTLSVLVMPCKIWVDCLKPLGDALGVYQAGQIKKYQTEAQALTAIGITNQEQLIEASNKT